MENNECIMKCIGHQFGHWRVNRLTKKWPKKEVPPLIPGATVLTTQACFTRTEMAKLKKCRDIFFLCQWRDVMITWGFKKNEPIQGFTRKRLETVMSLVLKAHQSVHPYLLLWVCSVPCPVYTYTVLKQHFSDFDWYSLGVLKGGGNN